MISPMKISYRKCIAASAGLMFVLGVTIPVDAMRATTTSNAEKSDGLKIEEDNPKTGEREDLLGPVIPGLPGPVIPNFDPVDPVDPGIPIILGGRDPDPVDPVVPGVPVRDPDPVDPVTPGVPISPD